MKVRYIYSACVEIETNSTRILCDPWFTEGAFDGSWFHYPKVKDPLKVLNKPDYIYISHIHQDHYDQIFLKKILKKFKKAKIIVPNFKRNYLLNRMRFDGIPAKPFDHLKINKTNIHLVPNEYDITDIDSGIIVNEGSKTVMGLVDCVYNKNFHLNLKKIIGRYTDKIDLLMAPHSGANSFPHTFFNSTSEKKSISTCQPLHISSISFKKKHKNRVTFCTNLWWESYFVSTLKISKSYVFSIIIFNFNNV